MKVVVVGVVVGRVVVGLLLVSQYSINLAEILSPVDVMCDTAAPKTELQNSGSRTRNWDFGGKGFPQLHQQQWEGASTVNCSTTSQHNSMKLCKRVDRNQRRMLAKFQLNCKCTPREINNQPKMTVVVPLVLISQLDGAVSQQSHDQWRQMNHQ